ncbi:hypothetical protein K4749_39210 [Streptomyces sp. TRM72054]|uniref:hypothetical protein n=1 Tax=Streptomyces sp. TRM72054 TaxID=2870562 RepID=UPI001C8CB8A7|nr:hypothetical protein [Streptomyces sp. TRM72054]MBX9399415.1 hypothetical protein [Streptomyces sp. TRM72054]
MALAYKKAGDVAAGAQFMHRQVKVYERLVQVDPAKYEAVLEKARTDAAAFTV